MFTFLHLPRTIRTLISDSDTGGSGSDLQESAEQQSDGGNEPDQVDYEAKYKDMLAHSREWERRAKANKAAAVELAHLKESQAEEKQKYEALQAKLEAYEAENEQKKWKTEIAHELNVPMELLRGSTREQIQEHAEQIASVLHPKPKAPQIHSAGKQPDKPESSDKQEFIRQLFGE